MLLGYDWGWVINCLYFIPYLSLSYASNHSPCGGTISFNEINKLSGKLHPYFPCEIHTASTSGRTKHHAKRAFGAIRFRRCLNFIYNDWVSTGMRLLSEHRFRNPRPGFPTPQAPPEVFACVINTDGSTTAIPLAHRDAMEFCRSCREVRWVVLKPALREQFSGCLLHVFAEVRQRWGLSYDWPRSKV